MVPRLYSLIRLVVLAPAGLLSGMCLSVLGIMLNSIALDPHLKRQLAAPSQSNSFLTPYRGIRCFSYLGATRFNKRVLINLYFSRNCTPYFCIPLRHIQGE